jgi:hypothetical protein
MRIIDCRVKTADIQDGAVNNAKVSAGAAIVYSKLNLATSIVNGDIVNGTISEPKLVVPTGRTKNTRRTARFEYAFATDGGAVGVIPFRGEALPANSIIVNGRMYVVHELLSGGAASAGITAVAGQDILADALIAAPPWNLPAFDGAIIPVDTALTDVLWAAGGIPTLDVDHFNLTDGSIVLYLDYIVI